jgi:hypothetical protein
MVWTLRGDQSAFQWDLFITRIGWDSSTNTCSWKKSQGFFLKDGRFYREELAEILDPNSQTGEDEIQREYEPIEDAADHNEVNEED